MGELTTVTIKAVSRVNTLTDCVPTMSELTEGCVIIATRFWLAIGETMILLFLRLEPTESGEGEI